MKRKKPTRDPDDEMYEALYRVVDNMPFSEVRRLLAEHWACYLLLYEWIPDEYKRDGAVLDGGKFPDCIISCIMEDVECVWPDALREEVKKLHAN